MNTTKNPRYGHYLVRRSELTEPIIGFGYSLGLCSMSGKYAYGVFKINHARYSYDKEDNDDPRKAFKIDLEPIGMTDFQRRDWYACDIFSSFSAGRCHVFDDYQEAMYFANDMNNIKEV